MTVTHRIVLAAAAAFLVAAALAGCSQNTSDLDTSVAASLQAATQKVRDDAAAGRYASALQELATIETQANDAAAQGKLSLSRKQDVLAAVALVRADLQALQGGRNSSSPTPSSSSTTTPSPKQKKDKSPAPGPDAKNTDGDD
ncbi:MAG: hypothetical protein HOQ07_10460 [Sinomonas sp.]|nr:hypothetical protein [Sinomonas sp.]